MDLLLQRPITRRLGGDPVRAGQQHPMPVPMQGETVRHRERGLGGGDREFHRARAENKNQRTHRAEQCTEH